MNGHDFELEALNISESKGVQWGRTKITHGAMYEPRDVLRFFT